MSEPGSQEQPDDALVDLLVKQVTEGLSPAEQRALDAMDSAMTGRSLRELERAAAAVTLTAPRQPLPPALRARLTARADAFIAASTPVPIGSAAGARAAPAAPPPSPSSPSPSRAAPGGMAGWYAAAACLLLAVFGWLRGPSGHEPPVAALPPPPPVIAPPQPAPPATPTPAEERAALLAKLGSVKIPLAATKDPAGAGVSGDVVWDPETQKGYLHFVGLAPNDPQVKEYQIWIFDGARDKRYPIDGGVFDVPAGSGDVVIPIRAALAVRKPAAFAITVEKPGGVVVSARDHVVALGAAAG